MYFFFIWHCFFHCGKSVFRWLISFIFWGKCVSRLCIYRLKRCSLCMMFKLQMACGYQASAMGHRSECGPILQNSRVWAMPFPHILLPSQSPSPSLSALRLFFSRSGMWWRSVNVASTKASFKMDFPSLCFWKSGGLCHREPRFENFSQRRRVNSNGWK